MLQLHEIYAFRNKYYLSIYDTRIESRKFITESLLHKSERNLVFGLHDISVCGNGRVCLCQYHIQEKVRNIVVEILMTTTLFIIRYKLFKDNASCLHRKNVPLKKVNSKYILKSTLTPRLARKQFQKNTTGLERSRSWSSLDNANTNNEQDFTSQNYLTVHVSSQLSNY